MFMRSRRSFRAWRRDTLVKSELELLVKMFNTEGESRKEAAGRDLFIPMVLGFCTPRCRGGDVLRYAHAL